MSALSRFLVWETHRAKMSEKGGLKTPAMVKVPVPPDLTPLCVSKSNGEYLLVRNVGTGEQRTAFFELEPEDEDVAYANLIDFLFLAGAEQEWGNVASRVQVEPDIVDEVEGYFDEFDLELSMIHVGQTGFEALWDAELVGPVGTAGLPKGSDADSLEEMAGENFVVGRFAGRSIYYNENLGPYVVFSAEAKYVGVLTRIRDHVSVLVHNPERGLVIVRIDEVSETHMSETKDGEFLDADTQGGEGEPGER